MWNGFKTSHASLVPSSVRLRRIDRHRTSLPSTALLCAEVLATYLISYNRRRSNGEEECLHSRIVPCVHIYCLHFYWRLIRVFRQFPGAFSTAPRKRLCAADRSIVAVAVQYSPSPNEASNLPATSLFALTVTEDKHRAFPYHKTSYVDSWKKPVDVCWERRGRAHRWLMDFIPMAPLDSKLMKLPSVSFLLLTQPYPLIPHLNGTVFRTTKCEAELW
uniref:Histone domain-containing protein n=1 Tax=Steinernema glaseri TaxID=37863 RepID=A0A1I7YBF2_9BILA